MKRKIQLESRKRISERPKTLLELDIPEAVQTPLHMEKLEPKLLVDLDLEGSEGSLPSGHLMSK